MSFGLPLKQVRPSGEKVTEEDVAMGYRFMAVGYAASRELFLMSFKTRGRDNEQATEF